MLLARVFDNSARVRSPVHKRRRAGAPAVVALLLGLGGHALLEATPRVYAADAPPAPPATVILAPVPDGAESAPQRFAVHGQLTYVEQEIGGFHVPYAGPNSLAPNSGAETVDATLFLGARLWSGAEFWLNPEIDQGFGLSNTLGVAGFPSGAAYKVGKSKPYFRLPRAFVRQTVDTGEAVEAVEASANQLAGTRSPDRWVVTVGKFGVTDVFDTNQYAHDPRADFLNWAAVDAGTFDYAADAWGFTIGAAVEWYREDWTLRAGLFDLSSVPNSEHLEPGAHEYQTIGEMERRYTLGGRVGRSLVTVYRSYGRMALLDDAVRAAEQSGLAVDPAAVRQYRTRTGISLSLEQAVNEDTGLFARLGSASGNVEAYEFTDIDRALELGTSVKGSHWSRAQDTVGVVLLNHRISATRQRYLDAGGLGILVGDGKLPHPGPEQIVETYYNAAALPGVTVTLDYQWVNNPGYNRDRGPASIVALRVHAQF